MKKNVNGLGKEVRKANVELVKETVEIVGFDYTALGMNTKDVSTLKSLETEISRNVANLKELEKSVKKNVIELGKELTMAEDIFSKYSKSEKGEDLTKSYIAWYTSLGLKKDVVSVAKKRFLLVKDFKVKEDLVESLPDKAVLLLTSKELAKDEKVQKETIEKVVNEPVITGSIVKGIVENALSNENDTDNSIVPLEKMLKENKEVANAEFVDKLVTEKDKISDKLEKALKEKKRLENLLSYVDLEIANLTKEEKEYNKEIDKIGKELDKATKVVTVETKETTK